MIMILGCVFYNSKQLKISNKISKKNRFILFPALILSEYVKIYTEEKMKGQEDRRDPIIKCNYLITLILLAFLAINIYERLSKRYSGGSSLNLQIALLSYLSIFNNQYYWIFLFSYFILIKVLLKTHGVMNGITSFVLSVYIWCLYGYRYQ